MSYNAQFCNACSVLKIADVHTLFTLTDLLDNLSQQLAGDQQLREFMGTATPSIWRQFHSLWLTTASAHSSIPEVPNHLRTKLCLSVARFTRNLVAAVPPNQTEAFQSEPEIRSLIRTYTSHSALEEENALPVTRMLIQALSNLITANDVLTRKLWGTYLNLPMEELILIRSLGVPDTKTVTATLVLILNCIYKVEHQIELLANSPSGPRLCIALLDRIAALFDSEDSSEEGKAFDLGYTIFSDIIERGGMPALWSKISMRGEVVTPHQTVFLKLVDSFFHSSKAAERMPIASLYELCDVLLVTFESLAIYAQDCIVRAVGLNRVPGHFTDVQGNVQPNDNDGSQANNPQSQVTSTYSSQLEEVDLLLPKVCEALVLVSQCLISLTLGHGENPSTADGKTSGYEGKQDCTGRVSQSQATNKKLFAENLMETLRLLDLFLPRISLHSPTTAVSTDRPPRQNRNGLGSKGATDGTDTKGFSYLKRDLVRLLGIISYGNNAVQDQVRLCGGIPVVLNLCVVDERNPYLREHAIFALRNLLAGNAENQALVDAIQPVREADENGVLQDRLELVER